MYMACGFRVVSSIISIIYVLLGYDYINIISIIILEFVMLNMYMRG